MNNREQRGLALAASTEVNEIGLPIDCPRVSRKSGSVDEFPGKAGRFPFPAGFVTMARFPPIDRRTDRR